MAAITRSANPIGVTVGMKQGLIDWTILAPYIDFAISRAGELVSPEMSAEECLDPQFMSNCQGAYDLGIPFGASIVHYPFFYEQAASGAGGIEGLDWAIDKQVSILIKAITFSKNNFRKVDFIVPRFERFWINQAEYAADRGGGVSPNNVILFSARAFLNNIDAAQKAGWLPLVPVIPCSADWFIQGHTLTGGATLYDTFARYQVMECRYEPIPANTRISWDKLPTFYPVVTDAFHPTGLNGVTHIWEFTDEIFLPTALGKQSSFGLSCLWKRDAFWNLIGYDGVPVPTGGTSGTGGTPTGGSTEASPEILAAITALAAKIDQNKEVSDKILNILKAHNL